MIPSHRPTLGPSELAALAEVLDSRWLGVGEQTERFEEALRTRLGVRHAVGVSSGTAALHLALEALALPSGSEVLVPSLTFAATAQAIVAAGARPVFCEVHPGSLTLDVADAARRATARTGAVVPVHYGGRPCDMDALLAWSREARIAVVEDAAHAFGSSYKGRPVGTLGDVTCFSFDPIKNITCGEGGAVATDRDELAARVRLSRNLGMTREAWRRRGDPNGSAHTVLTTGYRYHLNNLNASIGLAQLQRMEEFRARKRSIVRRYDEAFADLSDIVPVTRDAADVFPFSYVILVVGERRDTLMRHLHSREVGASIEYAPNHLQPAFAAFRAPLPVTERLCADVLTLPLYCEMTDNDIDRVIDGVRSFFVVGLRTSRGLRETAPRARVS